MKAINQQFNIDNTRITDDDLTVALKENMEVYRLMLWSVWLQKVYDRTDDPDERDLEQLLNQWWDLSSKVEKALEFAELARYATGFDIPEDTSFEYIDVDAIRKQSNDRPKEDTPLPKMETGEQETMQMYKYIRGELNPKEVDGLWIAFNKDGQMYERYLTMVDLYHMNDSQ